MLSEEKWAEEDSNFRPHAYLSSHAVTRIVLSAVKVLTVVFGMGTGVTPSRIDTRQIYQLG